MKRIYIAIACLLLCVTAVFARAMPYEYGCRIDRNGLPEDVTYVDMLIPLSEDAEEFTAYNRENGEKYDITEESEIIAYNRDGFVSYTFHKKASRGDIELSLSGTPSEEAYVYFAVTDGFEEIEDFGKKYQKAKFAYLDKTGKVLAVTNEIDIWQGGYFDISIDIKGENATAEKEENEAGTVGLLFAFIIFVSLILLAGAILLVLIGPFVLMVCLICKKLKQKQN